MRNETETCTEGLDITLACLPVNGGVFELRAMIIDGHPYFDTLYIEHDDKRRERVRQSHVHTDCEIAATQIYAQRIVDASWESLSL